MFSMWKKSWSFLKACRSDTFFLKLQEVDEDLQGYVFLTFANFT